MSVIAVLVGVVTVGGPATMRLKAWTLLPAPFVAVMLSGNVPEDVGVPASVAVPSGLGVKLTPPGNAPVAAKVGSGTPVVVTVKVPATVRAKVVVLALVISGASAIESVAPRA